jgi:hypothetical protein
MPTPTTGPQVLVFDPSRRTNADLIADAARIGWLPEPVFDATYGLGRFWTKYSPERLVTNDLLRPADHAHDWTQRFHIDMHGQYGAVVFDGPYKFCLDLETQVLTRGGWKWYDEVRPGDPIWSLDHATGMADWELCTAVNIYDAAPTKVGVVEGRHLSIVATPDHRWPVISSHGYRVWKTTDELAKQDRLVQRAKWARTPSEPTIPDAMVELVAWFWTEGHVKDGSTYSVIVQSHVVNASLCDRIARCLEALYSPAVDYLERTGRTSTPAWRTRDEERDRRFIMSAAVGRELLAHAPGKVPSIDFLEALTSDQMELFLATSFAADGQNDHILAQAKPAPTEAFTMACLLAGRAVSNRVDANGYVTSVIGYGGVKPWRPGITWDDRTVGVWCPTVQRTGTWLARRSGTIYFTGNSGTPSDAFKTMDTAYGVQDPVSVDDKVDALATGALNCADLVAPGGFLLIKCMDQIVCGRFRSQTEMYRRLFEDQLGWQFESWLHLTSTPRPQRSQVKPRNNYSTLLAFRRRR